MMEAVAVAPITAQGSQPQQQPTGPEEGTGTIPQLDTSVLEVSSAR